LGGLAKEISPKVTCKEKKRGRRFNATRPGTRKKMLRRRQPREKKKRIPAKQLQLRSLKGGKKGTATGGRNAQTVYKVTVWSDRGTNIHTDRLQSRRGKGQDQKESKKRPTMQERESPRSRQLITRRRGLRETRTQSAEKNSKGKKQKKEVEERRRALPAWAGVNRQPSGFGRRRAVSYESL